MTGHLVQLTGPQGAFYVRLDHVASLGPAHLDAYHFPRESKEIRIVTTVGGSAYFVWDSPDNVGLLLGAS